jgi:hypothetical protein
MLARLARAATLAACAILAGCAATTTGGRNSADYATATASARYRPVDTPGTQRRAAQNDAEQMAHQQLLEAAGAVVMPNGMTVNQIAARDPRVRSELHALVRTAEVTEWKVDPACGAVTVWMRLDLNRVRVLASCDR